MSNERLAIIDFPTSFPIKVMGEQHPDFLETILKVVQSYAPDTKKENITGRNSSKGNYVSATVVIYAENQQQLDAIYQALTAHPLVKVVL